MEIIELNYKNNVNMVFRPSISGMLPVDIKMKIALDKLKKIGNNTYQKQKRVMIWK